MKTDIEIAQECMMEPITKVAEKAGIPEEYLEQYGKYKAKIDYNFLKKSDKKEGNSGNKTTGTIDVTVPAGSKNQELKIVVKDDEGSAVIYDDTNKPGDRIVRKVSGVGNVRIEVYLNGALVQETAL